MFAPNYFCVLGTNISDLDMPSAVLAVKAHVTEHRAGNYICVTGVHGVIEGLFKKRIRDAHLNALACVPDGMPLTWFGRLTGHKRINRVYGPDLMLETLKMCEKAGLSSFFYGGEDGVPDLLAEKMLQRFPALNIVGTNSPPFRELTFAEEEKTISNIDALAPDIVWIGLSTPKQEMLMHRWSGRVNAPLMIGVGAAFDFLCGRKKQAPRWMQRVGLEWFFRLCTEPGRLWRRYILIVPTFLILAPLQILGILRFSSRHESHTSD